ncbi:MAG: 3-hydroxyacyl-CoA dehydrogenase NAD-binding domain-containing protein [Bacteroidota bacterium]
MKVAIIGCGAMGSGIAQIAAAAGNPVLLFDKYPSALDRSQKQLRKRIEQEQRKGRMSKEKVDTILTNLRYTNNRQDIAGSDIVIESIVEELEAKQQVFRDLEQIVSRDCILATNTSALSVTAIASACRQNPGRVIGIHFFIPAPQIKLVEIVPALQTLSPITKLSEQIIRKWGKTTVLVKDRPGFLVNRIVRPFYLEALRILEEGIADIATIDWAMKEIGRFKMGPFALMDYIGNDINYHFSESLFKTTYYDNRYQPSITQAKLVEAGYLGRKTGRGFYNYMDHSGNPAPRKDDELGRQILFRILVLLINEAADALFNQRASRDDIDLAMTTGIDFPTGLLSWADDLGIEVVVRHLDKLHNLYGDARYRCSPLLRNMKNRAERFY